MKNILFIGALALSLGLIIFLYQRLSATEVALKESQQHFADCQQVTFQLQTQLSQNAKGAADPSSATPSAK